MRHPILSRVPLVFLGTCFRWAVTKNLKAAHDRNIGTQEAENI